MDWPQWLVTAYSQRGAGRWPPKHVFRVQCVARVSHMCCSVLQCVAKGIRDKSSESGGCIWNGNICIEVGVFEECALLPCVTVCCRVLPCVAVCCSVLQCVAVHICWSRGRWGVYCSTSHVLQFVYGTHADHTLCVVAPMLLWHYSSMMIETWSKSRIRIWISKTPEWKGELTILNRWLRTWLISRKTPTKSTELCATDVKFRIMSFWVWYIPWPYRWIGLISRKTPTNPTELWVPRCKSSWNASFPDPIREVDLFFSTNISDRWLETWWSSRMRSGVVSTWQSDFALQVSGVPKEEFDERFLKRNLQWGTVLMFSQRRRQLLVEVKRGAGMCDDSGHFSRTRLKCSFTVVKTLLYCTRKWSCNLSCTSALSLLQLPCNGSTGQAPLPKHEISHGTPGTCTRCSFRKFRVLRGGPDQLNRCKEAAAGSMLTWSSNCSFISWYNTIGFLPPWRCTRVAFWKNSHLEYWGCRSRQPGRTWLMGSGAVLVLMQNNT